MGCTTSSLESLQLAPNTLICKQWHRTKEVLALSVIDHIASLLDSIEIKYTREDRVLMMRWKTEHFEDLKIRIETNEEETWVYIIAPFTNFYEVAEANRMKLAYDMLKESWKANGVKFAIDNEDDIIVLAESNDTDLTSDEVKTLVGHVVHACDTLWEIYPTEEAVDHEVPSQQ